MQSSLIPLFPLDIVVCPEGLITLNIFEPRYLYMVQSCLWNQTSFVITAVIPEGDLNTESNLPFASVGTLVHIQDSKVPNIGQMHIRCKSISRVTIESFIQSPGDLHYGKISYIPNDLPVDIPDDLQKSSRILQALIEQKNDKESLDLSISKPYKFNDSSWVSNRWVELLSLPLLEKQRLMELDSPIMRLELIQDILDKGYTKIF